MDIIVRALNSVGSKFWDLANVTRWIAERVSWPVDWLGEPFNWLTDAFEAAAYASWDAAEGAYNIISWVGDRAQELWNLSAGVWGQIWPVLSNLYNQVQGLASLAWEWLTNQVNWLLSQVAQLWDRFWGWAEPLLNAAWAWLGQLASYVTDTLWPWVQGQVTNLWDWINQRFADTLAALDALRQSITDLNTYRSLWDSLMEIKDRLFWFATVGWDLLTRFVADPGGTTWALLEAGLWPRVEAWLITVWDGTDQRT